MFTTADITHRDKVFFPGSRITKGTVADYYAGISPYIMPYVKDRPVSLLRHPHGLSGEGFFQKDLNDPPPWAETLDIYSKSAGKEVNYLICRDEAALLYMVQLGCIEINSWNSRAATFQEPDWAALDLDPEGIGFDAVVETAHMLYEVLKERNLPSFPKTSGKTGLHIYLPLKAGQSFEQARAFARELAETVHARLPKITSLTRDPDKRQGKVYVDYLQNSQGQTLAAPYSLRPTPEATVATPLSWNEVSADLDPTDFTISTIQDRLKTRGDLFADLLTTTQRVDINKV